MMPDETSSGQAAQPLKDQAQIAASIERFRASFWERRAGLRPPVAVVPERTWMPIGYLKRPFDGSHVQPADVTPALVRTDYEDGAIGRAVRSDDWLPYSAPWRAVPWLEAICGCRVRYATGSLAPEPCATSAQQMAGLELAAAGPWYDRLNELTKALVASAPDDCFVSPTILRGPSDVLAAMRGMSSFYLDLHDDPLALALAAGRVNRVFLDLLARHWAAVPPRHGGYGHIYGYWAPGPTNVLQEDVLGMCSPRVYADIFMPLNAAVVRDLGPYTLFHLHSTGLRHYRHVLDVPGIAGLEITLESIGPTLSDLTPVVREILERSRLMLFVDAHFQDLPALLRQVPHDGLYLIISDKFIGSEADYRAFVAANWRLN